MKYLKTFESIEELDHLHDLFADIKDVFDVKVAENERNKSISLLIKFDDDVSNDSTSKEDVAFEKLDMLKVYSEKLDRLQFEVKKILKFCNCRYNFQLKSDCIYIDFYRKKSSSKE